MSKVTMSSISNEARLEVQRFNPNKTTAYREALKQSKRDSAKDARIKALEKRVKDLEQSK